MSLMLTQDGSRVQRAPTAESSTGMAWERLAGAMRVVQKTSKPTMLKNFNA